MSILRGVHVEVLSDAWPFLEAARPALVKVVNPDAAGLAELRREIAPDVIIARLTNDHQDLTPTPREAAERWWAQTRAKVAEIAPLITYLEVPVNEAHETALAPFAEATARYVQLTAQYLDVRCIVGNLARGNPPNIGSFRDFIPALEAARQFRGALGLHLYFHRHDMGKPWQLGREELLYSFVPAELRLPVYATEYGLDNGDLPNRRRDNSGWRHAGYENASDYVLDLNTGLAALSSYVRGVCLFNVGNHNDRKWASFDSDTPEVRRWIAAGPRVAVPKPVPPPPSEEKPVVDPITDTLRAKLGSRIVDARGTLPDRDTPSGRFGARLLDGVQFLAIHHSAGPANQTARAIYEFHTQSNGWSGIGYHFLVYASGIVVYVGDVRTARANVAGQNHLVIGICFVGTFTDSAPTDAALRSGADLVRTLREVLGWPVPLRPHRAWGGTICPGNRFQEWAPRLDAPVPDFAKVTWALEEAARLLQREGLQPEHDFVLSQYAVDARARRDAQIAPP